MIIFKDRLKKDDKKASVKSESVMRIVESKVQVCMWCKEAATPYTWYSRVVFTDGAIVWFNCDMDSLRDQICEDLERHYQATRKKYQ